MLLLYFPDGIKDIACSRSIIQARLSAPFEPMQGGGPDAKRAPVNAVPVRNNNDREGVWLPQRLLDKVSS